MPTFVPTGRDHEPIILNLPVYDMTTDTWETVELRCKQVLPPRLMLDIAAGDETDMSIERLVDYWTAVLSPDSAAVMADILTGDNQGIDLKVLTEAFGWVMGQLGVDGGDPSLPPV